MPFFLVSALPPSGSPPREASAREGAPTSPAGPLPPTGPWGAVGGREGVGGRGVRRRGRSGKATPAGEGEGRRWGRGCQQEGGGEATPGEGGGARGRGSTVTCGNPLPQATD
eukprot:Gb_11373 [translate_table: standard]